MTPNRFFLHTSNQSERLTDSLLQVVSQSPTEGSSLLTQETVMILNPGVARWLQFDIAKKQGIAAGWNFPFTGKVFQNLIAGFFPNFSESGTFDEAIARWHIYGMLNSPDASSYIDFAEEYCQGSNGIRTYPLAAKLAALFDEYLIYRPDLIIDWEDNPKHHPSWLAKLWRRLIKLMYPARSGAPMHIARCWSKLKETTPSENATHDWPQSLHIFGISLLAPLYLDCLQAFAQYRNVHIYLLQPSDMYWADLRTGRQLKKASQRQRQKSPSPSSTQLPLETGSSSLLPAWGRQGQSFLDLLVDRDPLHDDSAFCPPAEDTQLHILQSDLFHIRERDANLSPAEDFLPGLDEDPEFPAYDGSIQIHATCSKQRECQALWDFLIDQFHNNPDLKPDDILVMAPNIQEYLTQIKSVFEANESPEKRIPYSIADRSIAKASKMASALSQLLELPNKRVTSLELLEFIEQPAIMESFDLSPDDLSTIETWIRTIGVRWGWNPKHRSFFQSSEKERDTWQEFRRRLSLGIALGGDEDRTSRGQLPFPHVEGNYAPLAGRLLSLMKTIDKVMELYLQEKSTSEWAPELCTIVRELFLSSKTDDRELRSTTESIQSLFPENLSIRVIGRDAYRAVSNELLRESPRSGFLNGAVTFCSLKPMRSIPAKIICLIGMNSGAFPRADNRNNFDIIASNPRPGDRNAREEDKQIFLETILSAREALFLGYQNVSPTSDDQLPPSPLLSQLIDYIESNTTSDNQNQSLITTHKRQAHDDDYFLPASPLFTYDQSQSKIANSFNRQVQPNSTPPTAQSPKTHNADTSQKKSLITVDALLALLAAPCKYFQQNVCGIRQLNDYQKLEEAETLKLDGLENYKMHETYLNASQQTAHTLSPEILSLQKIIPSGHRATILDSQCREGLEGLREKFPIVNHAPSAIKHEAIIEIASTPLHGSYSLIDDKLQLIIFPGKLKDKGKRILYAWIHHLFANAAHSHQEIQTIALSTQEPATSLTLSAPANAHEILTSLIELFEQGHHSPLPHFPDPSMAFAKAFLKAHKKKGEPLNDAEKWELWKTRRKDLRQPDPSSKNFQSTNAWDSYAQACFGEELTDGNAFSEIAESIWIPLLESSKG